MEIINIEQELDELEHEYQAFLDELHNYAYDDSDYAAIVFEMNMTRLNIDYICEKTYQGA